MKWCVYRACIIFLTTIIFMVIVGVCALNISIVLDEKGLEIIEMTGDTIVLNGGSSTIAVMLGTTEGLTVGAYVPVVDALKPSVERNVLINALIIGITGLVFLYDILDIAGLIKKNKAKKGIVADGEIVGYEHAFLWFYSIRVNAQGTIYHCRYPICKFEMKRYAEGTHATVWNGGVKKIWVEPHVA